jgi:DNA-directed RNA polymerase specialized sigma54-like protein
MDTHAILGMQALGCIFGAIDRTVLTSCTTEANLQMIETALQEPLHMMVNQFIHRLQESGYLSILLQEINDWLV